MIRTFVLLVGLTLFVLLPESGEVRSQEATVSDQKSEVRSQESVATKRALVVCGLSGDAAHHKQFTETINKLHDGLTKRFGFGESDVQLLFGDESVEADTELIKSAGKATREELEKSVAALRTKLQPNDALWVIVVGHSHYDGKHSWLNLPGPDIQQLEFAKLFEGLSTAQQVFVLTTPTSGFFIKPLSAKGRIIMSATEADWETNETEFPLELARVLSAPPAAKDFDIDEDGAISLFDLYAIVARNLAQSYLEREFLATEHPLLDDNGDGRGTDVQIDFLTTEQGGRANPRKPAALPKKNPTSDGGLSKSIVLSFSPAEPEGSATESKSPSN